MFCSQCGKVLNDDSRFCTYCGASVAAAPENTAPETAGISAPVNESAAPETAGIAPEAAGIAPEAAGIAPETAGIAPETAGIAPETAGIAPETASVAPETASVAPETAGVAPEAAGIAPEATSTPVTETAAEPRNIVPENSAQYGAAAPQVPPQPTAPLFTAPVPTAPAPEEKEPKYYTFGHIALCLAAVAVMAIVAGVFAGLYFSVV